MSEENGIKTINFDGKGYKVEDLTPRVVEGFNMLVKLQQELANISYELKKCQSAQVKTSEELKVAIEEDKIKPVEKENADIG